MGRRSSVSSPKAATRVHWGHSGETQLIRKFPSAANGPEAEGRHGEADKGCGAAEGRPSCEGDCAAAETGGRRRGERGE
ncbi:hypothetical protein NDU88_001684 [Pleurodeles waltl]|uniref:Uncharacterized protein n=1 Tax=Pleurodeles waltl TaxID=8319 RepID=A0AAV7SB41_PLEWA|nr:hypothetical protein NDU88_001684 [Pleurodeles waltl]